MYHNGSEVGSNQVLYVFNRNQMMIEIWPSENYTQVGRQMKNYIGQLLIRLFVQRESAWFVKSKYGLDFVYLHVENKANSFVLKLF